MKFNYEIKYDKSGKEVCVHISESEPEKYGFRSLSAYVNIGMKMYESTDDMISRVSDDNESNYGVNDEQADVDDTFSLFIHLNDDTNISTSVYVDVTGEFISEYTINNGEHLPSIGGISDTFWADSIFSGVKRAESMMEEYTNKDIERIKDRMDKEYKLLYVDLLRFKNGLEEKKHIERVKH